MSIGWHRDRPYMGFDPKAATTAWVALSDSTLANGCMRAAPGPARFQGTRGRQVEVNEAEAIDVVLRAVLDHAARLLSTPVRLEEADPIRFHLLHRPDGRDVLLMQYNHTLMDNNAVVLILRQHDKYTVSSGGCLVGEEERIGDTTCTLPEAASFHPSVRNPG